MTSTPTVSLSTNVTTLIESESTVLSFDFNVDGDIPEGGLPISLDVNAPDLLWITDFANFSRTGLDDETGLFDSIFIFPEPVGFGGEISSRSGSLLVRGVLEPFDSIPLILTENQASFQLAVFDDIFAEENETVEFSIGEGEGYTVGSEPVTVTIQDGPEGIINPSDVPVIGISLTAPDILVEDDPDNSTLTVTFNVEGEIPEEGINVILESDMFNILPDFDVDAEIIRDDDGSFIGVFLNRTETTGFSNEFTMNGATTSLDFLPIELGRGFDGNIVEQTASFTLNVNNDSIPEVLETFNFTLVDGEAYDVAPDAGTVTVTIADPPIQPPIVGTDESDQLEGTNRNDTILTLDGGDFVYAGDGNDTVEGGDGDDFLNGDAGIDNIDGGAGNDFLQGGDGNDSVLGGDGDDNLLGGDGFDTLFGGLGADVIFGEDGGDIVSGDAGSDTIIGGEGRDSVFGGDDDDFIVGRAGNDLLSGDDGDDEVLGGDGDDLLMGVTGNDTLIGGAGSDTFVFGNGDGTDIIEDFEDGVDLIGLVEGELVFEDLAITTIGSFVAIDVIATGERLALLPEGSGAVTLTEEDFVAIEDISSIDAVL
ncbi:MAG: calcium-binding protein [Cyanobacteria bacterium J06621_8]